MIRLARGILTANKYDKKYFKYRVVDMKIKQLLAKIDFDGENELSRGG